MKNHGDKQSKLDSVVKSSGCTYTEVINLRIPHRGTASLAQVSTMGLCPLPWIENLGGGGKVKQVETLRARV